MSAILSTFCGLASAQGTAASSGLWLPCLYLLLASLVLGVVIGSHCSQSSKRAQAPGFV